MPTLAHIVNLFQPLDISDLKLAQEVTVKTMIGAKDSCSSTNKIELFSAQIESDRIVVPAEFKATENLTRDVRDHGTFSNPVPLPILKDILDRLYNESDAEYLIFTNVDIGLQPHFYEQVLEIISSGHDAFIINRRRIPAKFHSVDQLVEMFNEKGLKHPGFDCFVFHRDLYPKFALSDVCIGVPFIGITLAQNLFCFAQNPKVFTDEHLTFHIGLELFKKRAPKEYLAYNRAQFWKSMKAIWPHLDTRKWPKGNWWLPFRMIYWGLHPSLPIRLALMLEKRRWLKPKAHTA